MFLVQFNRKLTQFSIIPRLLQDLTQALHRNPELDPRARDLHVRLGVLEVGWEAPRDVRGRVHVRELLWA